MSTARNPNPYDGEPLRSPITEPVPRIGNGHPEYHFVQGLMELQAAMQKMDTDLKVSMTRLESKLEGVKDSVDSTKKKVDDLVRWKTLILGGAIALGAVTAALWGAYAKFGDRITIAPAPANSTTPATTPSVPRK